jgi:hypothetical protein
MGAFVTLHLLQVLGKKKGNQFRRLRGLSYFSLKKESGSRNMNIYINIFSILLYGTWYKDRNLKLKLLRCVVEVGRKEWKGEENPFSHNYNFEETQNSRRNS